LTASVGAKGAKRGMCHARFSPSATGVTTRRVTAPVTGLVQARLTGARGDWDLAVFDAVTKRMVGASATTGTRELAEGFVYAGERLAVQACRFSGAGPRARLRVTYLKLDGGGQSGRLSMVRVHAPTLAERNRLNALDLDLDEGHGPTWVDMVVRGPEDLAKLRKAGFTWTVRIPDLGAHDLENFRKDRAYARATTTSALPSGRDEYRHLADYEAEMKGLAVKYPGLVKLIELPLKSLEGRPVLGVEITQNVNAADGKPIFLQLGIHHAREWPAGEHPMEWAYELATKYGTDARTTELVNRTRTIVVPIVNPDGFNISREGAATPGELLEAFDNTQLPQGPTAYGVLCCGDLYEAASYKRKNCRLTDGQAPAAGACEAAPRSAGVDPNRNYGSYWGGAGASWEPENDTYRGAGPFSEPETENVRRLIASRQVTTMITNHTFTGLVLRPPGVRSLGAPVDEAQLKELGDAMAAQNGYVSEPGYGLYDTTGTTEDWSYAVTGGFGYTFEIGKRSFHPDFESGVVGEYEGTGEHAGKGNRGAYYVALESTANEARHSVLEGTAPAGTTLRLHKEFDTLTSNVLDKTGFPRQRMQFQDVLDSTMTVDGSGRFEWHTNPSTRPAVAKDFKLSDVGEPAGKSIPVPYQGPNLPTQTQTQEFTIAESDPRRLIKITLDGGDGDDYDIYLYRDEVKPENLTGSSAGPTADENLLAPDLDPGKYVLEIVNYAAVQPYEGKIEFFPPAGEVLVPARTESYRLTCERANGAVFATRDVTVARGQRLKLGTACKPGSEIGLTLAVTRTPARRALARGLVVRARCAVSCAVSATATLDAKTARRLRLTKGSKAVTVARVKTGKRLTGSRKLTLKFTRKARARLRSARRVRLTVVGIARGAAKSRQTVRKRVTLRR
jgi:hypothetical protein